MPPEPRILLDECLPELLYRDFPVETLAHSVKYAGFLGLKNGKLLAAARDRYDVIVTVDQAFENEQNIAYSNLSLITVEAGTQEIAVLRRFVPRIIDVARIIASGQVIRLSIEDLNVA